jgi:two-component system, sporulation sensor kinase C
MRSITPSKRSQICFISCGGKCDREAEGYRETAEKELQSVAHITAQSLRFYRQSTKAAAVRPVDLISSVLDLYARKLVQRDIKVLRKDSMSESIVCFESEVRQVISNLVRNAMDAMSGSGGTLLIRTREATQWRSGAKGVVITVADTGTGMSRETTGRIFKAFYSTKGVPGTGLGLWVSSEIANRHHGQFLVSEPRLTRT